MAALPRAWISLRRLGHDLPAVGVSAPAAVSTSFTLQPARPSNVEAAEQVAHRLPPKQRTLRASAAQASYAQTFYTVVFAPITFNDIQNQHGSHFARAVTKAARGGSFSPKLS